MKRKTCIDPPRKGKLVKWPDKIGNMGVMGEGRAEKEEEGGRGRKRTT